MGLRRELRRRRQRKVLSSWAGQTLGSGEPDLRNLIAGLRPVNTEHPLIRIGGKRDGGYLIPDDLEGISACFSPGVGATTRFEEELARRYRISCYLADASVTAPSFDPALAPWLDFERKFIGNRGAAPDVMRLNDWITAKCGPMANRRDHGRHDLLLQMDIEGGEYDVLPATPGSTLRRFRILVIEFHDLHRLFDAGWRYHAQRIFNKIIQDFYCVHIHPCNFGSVVSAGGIDCPDVMEMTFQRKDRVQRPEPVLSAPHPLDRACNPWGPDIVLPDLFLGTSGGR